MNLLDQYGANPLTSAVLKRGLDDVLAYGQHTLQPMEFVAPTDVHPIAEVFTYDARNYASAMEYRPSTSYELTTAGMRRISFGSRLIRRPPNPDYFFAAELPYAVGYVDGDGAGMTYGWTPLGYMLFHDRINYSESIYWRLINDSGTDAIIEREIWARMFGRGVMFKHGSPELSNLTRIIISTDPPADLIPLLMWDHDYCRRETNAVNAVIDACEDFQARWNCGEWRSDTHGALRTLFGLQKGRVTP
jgi:hypothetical protein